MFGLFKRSKIEYWEVELLGKTLKMLPEEYSSLIDQISDGLFRGVLIGASDIPGYIAFTFNSDVFKNYDNNDEPDYKLTNIFVYNKKSSNYLPYEIYISSGTISGYSLNGSKKPKLDVNKIKVSDFKKVFIGDSDYNRISNLLDEEEKKYLSASEIYSVIIEGKEYFHLKDLEDGDFIGMDSKKNVYRITHDPMEVERLDNSLIDLIK